MAAETKPISTAIVAKNKFSNVFKAFNTSVKGMTSGVAKMNAKMLQSSAIIGQKGQQMKKTGQAMSGFGKSMSLRVTAPILAHGAVAVKIICRYGKRNEKCCIS